MHLFIGDYIIQDEWEISWVHVGDVSPLWSACPNLQELTLQGGAIELGTIEAPNLRKLSLRTGGLPSGVVKSLEVAQLPELEELDIWFGDEGYGAEVEASDLVPLLAREDLPNLRVLRLKNAEFTDELIAFLVDSALLRQVEELDLSMGIMSMEGVRRMCSEAESFSHLKKIDLSDNCIDALSAEAAIPSSLRVTLGEQEKYDPGDLDYRYVSVGE
jgi:hypothetical protein